MLVWTAKAPKPVIAEETWLAEKNDLSTADWGMTPAFGLAAESWPLSPASPFPRGNKKRCGS